MESYTDFMTEVKLFELSSLEDKQALGMVAQVAGKRRNIFIVRWGCDVHAYLNWCPHNQVLIDQVPGQFFNSDKTLIQCSKHGALFRIEDGFCIEGPCEGQSLSKLKCEVKDGGVYLNDT